MLDLLQWNAEEWVADAAAMHSQLPRSLHWTLAADKADLSHMPQKHSMMMYAKGKDSTSKILTIKEINVGSQEEVRKGWKEVENACWKQFVPLDPGP